MLSKACVVGAYQRKLEAIAACPGVELTVAVPPAWRDARGMLWLERAHTTGYRLVVEPIWFNGQFHWHFYPRFGALVAQVQPAIVHIDEEPYDFVTWHAQGLARRAGAKTLFFSWQNLLRHYPPPFSWLEQAVLRRADYGLMGNAEALAVWRAKGYAGPATVLPQFGVDPEIFAPRSTELTARPPRCHPDEFVIGFAGRLVAEKGVDVLMDALAQLPSTVRLRIVGGGPEQAPLQQLAQTRQVAARVSFEPGRPSTQMPSFFGELDCLVLPSRTRPNWKEQFGRVLIEAMACGVPVVGARSGEIPNVIGDAGLTFPEGDAPALASALTQLHRDPTLRAHLATQGRARVLAHYTQQHIAEATVAVYREILAS